MINVTNKITSVWDLAFPIPRRTIQNSHLKNFRLADSRGMLAYMCKNSGTD